MAIPDSTAGWMQGIQIGSNIASNAMAQRLRIQELKSLEAHRRAEEKMAADALAFKMSEFKREVDINSTVQKSLAAYGAMTAASIPDPNTGSMVPNPARMDEETAFRKLVVEPVSGLDAKLGTSMWDNFQNQRARQATESRLSKQALEPPLTSDITNTRFEQSLKREIAALPAGSPERKAKEEELSSFMTRSTPAGMSIETTSPDGTKTVVTTGRGSQTGKSDVPTSVIADAERSIGSASNAVKFFNDVQQYATQSNVGVRGALSRLSTEIMGQFGDVKPGDEFKYAQAAGALRAMALKVLRSDSNITEKERVALESNLPSVSLSESDESAREKARNIAAIMIEVGRTQASRAGRAIPPEMMTQEELVKEMQSGKLTAKQAAMFWHNSPLNRR